jgi:hypothetical protein
VGVDVRARERKIARDDKVTANDDEQQIDPFDPTLTTNLMISPKSTGGMY